jgi:gamma-glutamylcyclotransferase (GGCT)/AIG2-like uncharacterized protein YtfP
MTHVFDWRQLAQDLAALGPVVAIATAKIISELRKIHKNLDKRLDVLEDHDKSNREKLKLLKDHIVEIDRRCVAEHNLYTLKHGASK